MNFLYKIEKKFGKYAINNLSAYVVGSWVMAYLLSVFAPNIYELLIFDIELVFSNHEFWRIFTWIFTIPGQIDILTILMLFVYFSIGTSIEKSVGAFLYNIYIFGSYIMITIAMVVQGAILNDGIESIEQAVAIDAQLRYVYTPTYFISMSVFLGFALVFSESMMLLFFAFPVKTKWLAYADVIYMVYMLIMDRGNTLITGIVLAVLLNFYLFYLISKKYSSRRMRNWRVSSDTLKRQKEFKKQMKPAQDKQDLPKGITRHKCAICGRTEADDEELEFRFCSRCNGNYEYCNDHLFTHEHVK